MLIEQIIPIVSFAQEVVSEAMSHDIAVVRPNRPGLLKARDAIHKVWMQYGSQPLDDSISSAIVEGLKNLVDKIQHPLDEAGAAKLRGEVRKLYQAAARDMFTMPEQYHLPVMRPDVGSSIWWVPLRMPMAFLGKVVDSALPESTTLEDGRSRVKVPWFALEFEAATITLAQDLMVSKIYPSGSENKIVLRVPSGECIPAGERTMNLARPIPDNVVVPEWSRDDDR